MSATALDKSTAFENLSKVCQSGHRSDQQSALNSLLQLYDNSFENFIVAATESQLSDILYVVKYSDEHSRFLVSSNQLPNILSNIFTHKYFSQLTKALEIIQNIYQTNHTLINFDLFNLLLLCIPSKSLELSEISCCLTELFAKEQPTLITQFQTFSLTIAHDLVIYLRFCSISAKLMSVSDILFHHCLEAGAVKSICLLCQTSDILTQIVAIELLRHLADTKSGLQYLFSSGMFQWLISKAYESFESEICATDPVLVAQCLREVSEIFHRSASNHLLHNSYWSSLIERDLLHKFLKSALGHLDSVTDETRLTGMHAITDFARSSPVALTMIVDDKILVQSWCQLLLSGKTDMQSCALHAFARVFESDYEQSDCALTTAEGPDLLVEIDVDAKKHILWEAIGEAKNTLTINYLLRLARQPVSSLRHGAVDVLCSLLKSDSAPIAGNQQVRSWGLQQLSSSAEFRDYVIDQESEQTKDNREWKYSLVQALSRHPQLNMFSSIQVSGESNQEKGWVNLVRLIEARGPHYRPPQQAELLTMEH